MHDRVRGIQALRKRKRENDDPLEIGLEEKQAHRQECTGRDRDRSTAKPDSAQSGILHSAGHQSKRDPVLEGREAASVVAFLLKTRNDGMFGGGEEMQGLADGGMAPEPGVARAAPEEEKRI